MHLHMFLYIFVCSIYFPNWDQFVHMVPELILISSVIQWIPCVYHPNFSITFH